MLQSKTRVVLFSGLGISWLEVIFFSMSAVEYTTLACVV